MWDILLNVLVGAAVGYAAYKIVEALWPIFVNLWEGLVAAVEDIFGYVAEATKDFLAGVAQFLQDQWTEIQSFIIETFGYISECIVFLFEQDREAYLGFMNPSNQETAIGLIGQAPGNVQLPKQQVIAGTLDLRR